MASTLRKIKLEIGGDAVEYAVARNDDIGDLERFRGRSEPTWMFLQNGKMVNLTFGAHCPRLQRLLMEEIRRVQQSEAPRWRLDAGERAPEEEGRWQRQETVRRALEERERAKEEAERKEKYERFMEQMVFELCEETALLLYPWVFKDEKGKFTDKQRCPPYTELVQDLFRQCFDVLEEARVQLNEDTIERMFVESGVDITEELIQGLTDGKCMVMRLRGKPPHPDWPVRYPYDCPDPSRRCPNRAIDDIENYLISIITTEPPPLLSSGIDVHVARPTYDDVPYAERHVHEPEVEGDVVYPAAWVPPQARSKVHVFKTLFPAYMEKAHPYEEPVPLPPLCAFKYEAARLAVLRDAHALHRDAVECFGVFEHDEPYAGRIASSPDDFEKKVKQKTGGEVFVVVVRRISEETFLAFAGIEPFFVTEDDERARGLMTEYFPEGAQEVIEPAPDEEEEEKEEEEMDGGEVAAEEFQGNFI